MTLRQRRLLALRLVVPLLAVLSIVALAVAGLSNDWAPFLIFLVVQWPVALAGTWIIAGRVQTVAARAIRDGERLAQFELATAHMSEGLYVCDATGYVTFINLAARTLHGLLPGTEGLRVGEIARVARMRYPDGSAIPREQLPVLRALRGETVKAFEHIRISLATGREYAAVLSAAPIEAGEGAIVGAVVLLRDVSEQKRLEAEVERMALTDPLTGLGNRRQLLDTLQREVARARREEQSLAVLMIDVDHFKRVNDTYGHAAGDKGLCHIATTLTRTMRSMDFISRFGGEEFVIVMPHSTAANAFAAARRVQEYLRNHALAVDADTTLPLQVSIGCAIFPGDGGDGEELVGHADTALYQAKEGGRNRIVMYSEHQPNTSNNLSSIGPSTQEV